MNSFDTKSMKINCCRPTFLSISTRSQNCIFVQLEVDRGSLTLKSENFRSLTLNPFCWSWQKPVSRVAFHLRKYQNCFVEFHFSCQNVNVWFGARYDELEARNKNKPHQHLEIYPITFFVNFETTFWAPQTATGRFRCWECLHWKERIFLSRIHVSTSFWDVRMTTKTSNLFALTSALMQNVLPSFCLNLDQDSSADIL